MYKSMEPWGSRPGGAKGKVDRRPAAPYPGRGMEGAAGTGKERTVDGE